MAMGPVPLVLVVDDEADVRTRIAEILEGEGYRTRALEPGEAALTLALTERSALILLAYTPVALLPGSDSAASAGAGLR
jgi:CheY-like chemotaxis protein